MAVWVVETNEDAREAVARIGAEGMDAVKIIVESGPTPFGDDHPQMSVSMIRAIVDEAKRYKLPVFAHVSSLDELEATLSGGADGVMHAVFDYPLPYALKSADSMPPTILNIMPQKCGELSESTSRIHSSGLIKLHSEMRDVRVASAGFK